MAKRIMGKAAFAKLRDVTGDIQLFLQSAVLADAYDRFKHWDVGDIVAAEGTLMRTKTGEAVRQSGPSFDCWYRRCGRCQKQVAWFE